MRWKETSFKMEWSNSFPSFFSSVLSAAHSTTPTEGKTSSSTLYFLDILSALTCLQPMPQLSRECVYYESFDFLFKLIENLIVRLSLSIGLAVSK